MSSAENSVLLCCLKKQKEQCVLAVRLEFGELLNNINEVSKKMVQQMDGLLESTDENAGLVIRDTDTSLAMLAALERKVSNINALFTGFNHKSSQFFCSIEAPSANSQFQSGETGTDSDFHEAVPCTPTVTSSDLEQPGVPDHDIGVPVKSSNGSGQTPTVNESSAPNTSTKASTLGATRGRGRRKRTNNEVASATDTRPMVPRKEPEKGSAVDLEARKRARR